MSTEAPTLTLNGVEYRLRWDLAALFRLQEAGRGDSLEKLSEPHCAFKALVDVLWASLPEAGRECLGGGGPRALVDALSREGEYCVESLVSLLSRLLEQAQGKKNATTQSLSPVSSSG